jgi:hypothetical protein
MSCLHGARGQYWSRRRSCVEMGCSLDAKSSRTLRPRWSTSTYFQGCFDAAMRRLQHPRPREGRNHHRKVRTFL